MTIRLFVTGTDTGVGKTYVSVGLLNAFKARGVPSIGIKLLASGGEYHGDKFYHPDALALQQASSFPVSYEQVNPILFKEPIAPHLAASYEAEKRYDQHGEVGGKRAETVLSVARLRNVLQTNIRCMPVASVYLLEGIGGWFVPLNAHETMADFVQSIDCRVIMVVGLRLGCLNHALLTYQAIINSRVPLAGWIANCITPAMPAQAGNIKTLSQYLKAIPCLGVVQYQQAPEEVCRTQCL